MFSQRFIFHHSLNSVGNLRQWLYKLCLIISDLWVSTLIAASLDVKVCQQTF